MTVRELIEELAKLDPDLVLGYNDDDETREVLNVDIAREDWYLKAPHVVLS